jgi:hypothetical protein
VPPQRDAADGGITRHLRNQNRGSTYAELEKEYRPK